MPSSAGAVQPRTRRPGDVLNREWGGATREGGSMALSSLSRLSRFNPPQKTEYAHDTIRLCRLCRADLRAGGGWPFNGGVVTIPD